MKNNELEQLKKQNTVEEKLKLERIKSRINELKKDVKVIEYIKLSNSICEDIEIEINHDFYKTCDEFAKSSKENYNIFYDFGKYNYRNIETLELLNLHIYRNIETEEFFYLTEDYEFKTLSIEYLEYIINLSNIEDEWRFKNNKIIFNVLRAHFLEKLVLNSYEEALNSIMCDKILTDPIAKEKEQIEKEVKKIYSKYYHSSIQLDRISKGKKN